MVTSSEPANTRPRRLHRWLLVLPFGWQLALAPVVNDVPLAPLGVPFPMLWQLLGIVFTTIVIGVVFRLDRKSGVDDEEAALLTGGGNRCP